MAESNIMVSVIGRHTAAHYDRLAAARSRDALFAEGWGAQACPLCQAHRDEAGRVVCWDCPVYLATGAEQCEGTPWIDLVVAILGVPYDTELNGPLPEVLAMRAFLDGLDWSGIW